MRPPPRPTKSLPPPRIRPTTTSGVSRADRLLWRWAISPESQSPIDLEAKEDLGTFVRAWNWAFDGVQDGRSTGRATRFLKVVRARAVRLYRAEVAATIGLREPRSSILTRIAACDLWRAIEPLIEEASK